MIRAVVILAALALGGCVSVYMPPPRPPAPPAQARAINPCGMIDCSRPNTRAIV